MVDKVMPEEITDAVTNNMKKSTCVNRKKRGFSEASIARPVTQELPEKFGEFTMPIPSLTAAEAQGQTAAKMDKGFERVFSKIVGDAPGKRIEKNPGPI